MQDKGEIRRWFVLTGLASLVFFAACGDGDSSKSTGSGSAGMAGDDGSGSGSGGSPGDGGTNSAGGAAGNDGETGAGGVPSLPPAVIVLPEALPPARVGDAYEVELTVQGAEGAIAWQSVGSLPPGLTLTDTGDSALLAGTPTMAGQFSVGLSVEDARDLGVRNFPLRVLARPWLLYTTDETVEAVDISTASTGKLSPHVLSRPLVGTETVWLGAEQPGGLQFVFGYDDDLEGQGWIVGFSSVNPGGAVRVSPPQGTKEHAREFSWSPDGSRMSFVAETEESEKEGFVVDVSGPTPGGAHKATGEVPPGGSLHSQAWGGKTLVFVMTDPVAGPGDTPGSRLSKVDTEKFPPPDPEPLSDWNVEQGWVTKDGKRVAYWGRVDDTKGEMWTLKIDTTVGAPELMHPPLESDESGDKQCTWFNKGTGAVVATNKTADAEKTLHRTTFGADGKPIHKAITDGLKHVRVPILSPDQKLIAFAQGADATDPESRLYLSDLSGDDPTEPVELNGPIIAGGAIPDALNEIKLRWSPDSQKIAYTASALDKDKREAFLVDVKMPGDAKRINEDLPGAASKVADVGFSPDGAWISLVGDLETAGVTELFLAPLAEGVPGTPVKVNDTLGAGENVMTALSWSPDGRYLAFLIQDDLGATYAYVVDLTGGSIGDPVQIGEDGDNVSNLRFLSAGF